MFRPATRMHRLTRFALPICLLVCFAKTGAAKIPPVVLSQQHQKMCLVNVGDQLPAMQLTTSTGNAEAIPLHGLKGTLLVFYQEPGWMTRSLLKNLGPDFAKPFADKGIATVAVCVGRTPEVTKDYLTLVDPDGKALAKLGTGKLPRVYVLDAKGKIVWFDIEYSRSTHRELLQVLKALSGE